MLEFGCNTRRACWNTDWWNRLR